MLQRCILLIAGLHRFVGGKLDVGQDSRNQFFWEAHHHEGVSILLLQLVDKPAVNLRLLVLPLEVVTDTAHILRMARDQQSADLPPGNLHLIFQ